MKANLILAVLFLGLTHFFPNFLLKAKQQQQILSATVMMTIITPAWQEKADASGEALPIPNDDYRTIAKAEGNVAADGLGTLVANGDNSLLVTHDHWSHLDEALGTVTFRAADGSWLADMDLRDFKDLIRNRDGGTMVLAAPTMLKTAVPVETASPQTNILQTGDRGFVAQRAGDRIVVNEVSVIDLAEKQGRPVVRLQSLDGRPVVGGDSGGGVWVNGRFTAVMWTTVMMEYRATGMQQATDMSVAAVYQLRQR